jgi:hypothetical protein
VTNSQRPNKTLRIQIFYRLILLHPGKCKLTREKGNIDGLFTHIPTNKIIPQQSDTLLNSLLLNFGKIRVDTQQQQPYTNGTTTKGKIKLYDSFIQVVCTKADTHEISGGWHE